MTRLADIMSRRALYVTPSATIATAVESVREQRSEGLFVVREGRVLGALDPLRLYQFHGDLPVTSAMGPALVLDAGTRVGEAAAAMERDGARQVAVTCNGRLAGTVGQAELLANWGAFRDRLTNLSWQGDMRQWAAGFLSLGREITILFIDLDEFGRFNKRHGHVVGDQLLVLIAEALRGCVENELDSLCRYGGDEFAVATLRSQDDAWTLARRLLAAVDGLSMNGIDETVRASIGIAGGKRRQRRSDAHPSATLDDLINLASHSSTRAKTLPERICALSGQPVSVEEIGPSAPSCSLHDAASSHDGAERTGRVSVAGWSVRTEDPGTPATVALRYGGVTEEASASSPEGDLRVAAAEATARCLQRLVPDVEIRSESLYVLGIGGRRELVVASIIFNSPGGGEEQLLGVAPLTDDPCRSAINAVLHGTNRRVAMQLAANGSLPPPAHSNGHGPGSSIDELTRECASA